MNKTLYNYGKVYIDTKKTLKVKGADNYGTDGFRSPAERAEKV
jgi:hypothetical protein